MNIAAAYEAALAATLRAYAEIGEDTAIRSWQNLSADPVWRNDPATGDRSLPCIDIRCAPPVPDADVAWNMTATATVEIRTSVHDDPDHREVSRIYDATQTLFDSLFDQFYGNGGTDGDELAAFKGSLDAEYGAEFPFGGLTYGDSAAPWDDDGVNCISFSFVLHYSRRAN